MEILADRINQATTKFILQENSVSAIPVELELSEKWFLNKPINVDDILELTSEMLIETERLAKAAFVVKDRASWEEVQKILYAWNIAELFRMNVIDNRSIVYAILRNKIIEIESKSRPKPTLECKNDFTPRRAIQELYDKAKSHRINNHPFLEELNKNGISQESTKVFLQNYYINNRVFHLFVATQSLSAPMEMRTELYKNLYDELGAGDGMLAHPILFLKNFDTIGKPSAIKPFPETLYLFNSKFSASFLSGKYHIGAGGLGFIEATMPDQMIKILAGLKKSGIPEPDLEFWRVHITIDLEHGKSWFQEMENLIRTPEEAEQCLQGGQYLLEARATMYDGVWNSIKQ